MPEVIRHGRVEADAWTFVGVVEPVALDAQLPAGSIVVPLPIWKARREELLARQDPRGVWLAPADDPAELEADLSNLSLVAVHYPRFTDGRGYSTAVLVRRSGFRGELRAFGDIGRDQLFYLSRCGFDAYALRPGADPADAIASLSDFSLSYQAAVDARAPLFRQRGTTTPAN